MKFPKLNNRPQGDATQAAAKVARPIMPPRDLHRLIYTSEALLPGLREDAPPVSVQDIARDAARRNTMVGLSGILVSVRGHFIQILEGEVAELETVFESICRDRRHRSLTLVDFSPATECLFEGWAMVPMDSTLLDDSEPVEDLFLSIRGGMAPAAIVREMRGLLDEVAPCQYCELEPGATG